MPTNRPVDLDQGSMLTPGSRGAEYVIEELEPSQVAVNALDSNLHLQNTLRILGFISQRMGLQAASYTDRVSELEARYGTNLDAVLSGSLKRGQRLATEAKQEFALGFGLAALTAGEFMTDEEAKTMARSTYEELLEKYAGSENRQARENKLIKLIRAEIVLGGKQPAKARKPKPEKPETELQPLSDQQKLRVLQTDPRAGFLPASNQEKSTALALLDYLDNPDHPMGFVHQLDEIFIHQQRWGGVQEGIRAMPSKVYEMGDFLANALESIKVLRDLQLTMRECFNPRVSVTEEGLGESNRRGVLAMIRFIDQREFRETGHPPSRVNFSLFRTHEDRVKPQAQPDKNKTLEDPYTRAVPAKVVARYLYKRISTLTIGEVRVALEEAIADQQRRARFWETRLYETRLRRFAWQAGTRVLESVR